MVDCISSSPLSCIFKSSFITICTAPEGTFSCLVFICLENSYSLTSLFVDEFCDALRNIKTTIFNLTGALSTQTCLVKYANWRPPG